jgi:hypothetical protein
LDLSSIKSSLFKLISIDLKHSFELEKAISD